MKGKNESNRKIELIIHEKLSHYPAIVTQYYEWLLTSSKTLNTIYAYIKIIAHFIDCQFGTNVSNDFYKQVGEADISIYLESIDAIGNLHNSEVSTSNKATKWSALNSFFRYLVPEYTDYNPVEHVSRPIVSKTKKIEFLTVNEVTTLLNNVQQQNREKIKNRDLCIMMLGFYCGLRSSAIVQADIHDINWDENKLRVFENDNEYYEVPLSSSVREQLQLWLVDRLEILGNAETDALFISVQRQRISDDSILHLLKTYSASINKVVTARTMRNTCIVNLYLETHDLALCAKLLNQTNIASVYRYIEKLIEISHVENAVQVLDDLYNFIPDNHIGSYIERYEKRPVPPVPILPEDREKIISALSIDELDLSVRTYNCLKRANVITVADIINLSSEDILQIRNIGGKVIDEIVAKLIMLNAPMDQKIREVFLDARDKLK